MTSITEQSYVPFRRSRALEMRSATGGFLSGDGEMGRLIQSHDWSKTPIGPIEDWSLSLRTMVSFMLANRFSLLLWWGPEYVSIYNDAYSPVLGAKHPWALGTPGRECWSEIWDILKPLVDTPFRGGPSTWSEDIQLEINRYGFLEETHFTVAYSPVPDESTASGIGGVLATVHEITEKIVGERRIIALRDLGACGGEAKSAREACSIAMSALVKHSGDVPFAAIYLFDDAQISARLCGAAGVTPGEAAAPIILDGTSEATWPVSTLLRQESTVVVERLSERFQSVPSGPWPDPPHTGVLVPIKSNSGHRLAGFLVAGVSPRLRFDDQYRSFFDLAAAQIASAIAAARAYEEERKRAEALAEIDRAKTLFFSNISHEFRTPLTLILGPLEEAIASTNLPAHERERLSAAHRNSLRLLKLVNSLLDFSRIEAGRVKASYEPVDLAQLTAELASNFRSACERAGLELDIDCPPLPAPVYVDRDMWEKIVLNLLSNAFKFTFEGRIAVTLRVVGGAAELKISDTGVGIPEHELPRVFERFHRIEGQKSRTFEGSGIGLALVQELVKLHGGNIAAANNADRGACVTVSIPLGVEHLPADRLAAMPTPASTPLRASPFVNEALGWLPDSEIASDSSDAAIAPESISGLRKGTRVLVADDNRDMREYVRHLLGRYCEAETVADGDAALRAIRDQKPDLLITDVMMPGLDGFGLVRAVRDDPALRDLPIIMLSARAGEESRVEGLDAGADDYLIKPFSARELVARVSANLKLARVRREGTEALRESERQYRELLGALPVPVYTTDAAGHLTYFNQACAELVGREPVLGSDEWCVTSKLFRADGSELPNDRSPLAVALKENRSLQGEEVIAERPDGRRVPLLSYPTPLHDETGMLLGGVNMLVDNSAQIAARERFKLLIDELNHRVKNTLAAVQSIAVQTLRNAANTTEGRKALEARLMALAGAHDVLTRRHWEGADIYEIVEGSLSAYRALGGGARLKVSGPNIRLVPRAALALSLALHELATNAVKYGALSNETGRVAVDWDIVDGRHFSFSWAEMDGPPVARPDKRGFGSRLIEQGLAQDLDGEVKLDFSSSGLRCTIAAPLDRMTAGRNRQNLPDTVKEREIAEPRH